ELGILTEGELLKQLGAQMRARLVSVLRWKEGDWRFVPGEPPVDRAQTPTDPARLVFAGLKKTAHIDEIAQTLARARGRVGLTMRAERHREAFVGVFGSDGLRALGRRPQLDEVMA